MDTVASTHVPSVPVAALAARLASPRWPVLLDVRRAAAHDASPWRLPAALRCPPEAVADAPAWLPPGAEVVCACVHGHEVSHGAAATLRALGVDARVLEGGLEAWRGAGLPLRRADAPLRVPPLGGSRWVTRARPKVDRIACPWMVRRFVDPFARVAWLPPAEVVPFAARTGALAFDVEGGTFVHEGDRCSFDALLRDAGIVDPALQRLAEIVRGADTGRCGLAPESAGLLAVSRGLARLHDDDAAMLEAGMTLYDALYAALREATADGTAPRGPIDAPAPGART